MSSRATVLRYGKMQMDLQLLLLTGIKVSQINLTSNLLRQVGAGVDREPTIIESNGMTLDTGKRAIFTHADSRKQMIVNYLSKLIYIDYLFLIMFFLIINFNKF